MKFNSTAFYLTYLNVAILTFLSVILIVSVEISNNVSEKTCLVSIGLSLTAALAGFWLVIDNNKPSLDQNPKTGLLWFGILAWIGNFFAIGFVYGLLTADWSH